MQTSQAAITQQSQQKYLLSGGLNFATVPDLMNQVNALLPTSPTTEQSDLVFDFSQVTECNSAALALILESVEKARLKNIRLQFAGLPTTLLSIAKAYGVEEEIKRLTI